MKTDCEQIKQLESIIGGKWRLYIIYALKEEHKRFNELKRWIPGISDRMLSKELKGLQLVAVVEKDTKNGIAKYALTTKGTKLARILDELLAFVVS